LTSCLPGSEQNVGCKFVAIYVCLNESIASVDNCRICNTVLSLCAFGHARRPLALHSCIMRFAFQICFPLQMALLILAKFTRPCGESRIADFPVLPTCGFSGLVKSLGAQLGIQDFNLLTIRYQDEEGDFITVIHDCVACQAQLGCTSWPMSPRSLRRCALRVPATASC